MTKLKYFFRDIKEYWYLDGIIQTKKVIFYSSIFFVLVTLCFIKGTDEDIFWILMYLNGTALWFQIDLYVINSKKDSNIFKKLWKDHVERPKVNRVSTGFFIITFELLYLVLFLLNILLLLTLWLYYKESSNTVSDIGNQIKSIPDAIRFALQMFDLPFEKTIKISTSWGLFFSFIMRIIPLAIEGMIIAIWLKVIERRFTYMKLD